MLSHESSSLLSKFQFMRGRKDMRNDSWPKRWHTMWLFLWSSCCVFPFLLEEFHFSSLKKNLNWEEDWIWNYGHSALHLTTAYFGDGNSKLLSKLNFVLINRKWILTSLRVSRLCITCAIKFCIDSYIQMLKTPFSDMTFFWGGRARTRASGRRHFLMPPKISNPDGYSES